MKKSIRPYTYVYVHVYPSIHLHTRTHIHVHTLTYTCTCIRPYTYVYVHIYMSIHLRIRAHIYVHTLTHTCAYIRPYTYTCICTHTYVHTRTYADTQSLLLLFETTQDTRLDLGRYHVTSVPGVLDNESPRGNPSTSVTPTLARVPWNRSRGPLRPLGVKRLNVLPQGPY